MTHILDWLDANKQWVFSGIGVAAILALWQIVKRVRAWRRSRPTGPSPKWKGVQVGSRYFAWDGPILHSIPSVPPIPAPNEAISAIKALGATPLFGLQTRLRDHLASGDLQVYETDRKTWKRELLHPGYGDQVLLVKV